MKITHVNSGLAYDLKPGTQLEIERTNLFFNEWGEQSNPINLPDTDQNRKLTNYPDLLSGNDKPSASIPITIQDNNYFMHGRQAILSAQRKSDICTSFYMNEGSFLSRISDTSLKDVFKDETIPGVTTVQQGIDFCRSLISGSNNEYAIFPVLIDSNDSYNNGYPKYKFINRVGYTDQYEKWQDRLMTDKTPDFYNAITRRETIDGQVIDITPGFYMSPFIRGNYLLKRIFQYFGYSVLDNFFTKTYPFTDMIFINNCADSIVNGTIRIADLLPDCMCSMILDVYRKKFCCEFIPNEINHSVDICIFNEIVDSKPICELDKYLVSPYKHDLPETYQQIVLTSEECVNDAGSIESPESLTDLVNKYQYVTYDPVEGCFHKVGFMYGGIYMFTSPWIVTIKEKIATSSMQYNDGVNLKTKKIDVPDIIPEFRNIYSSYTPDNYGDNAVPDDIFLYIGSANFLNSKLIKSNENNEKSEINSTSENSSLKPMLSFFYKEYSYPRGTITNEVISYPNIILGSRRLSDYSLCYNGQDGIFERFYRSLDTLYRNSMHKVTASLLLSDQIKQSLPAHLPVLLHNQKLLLSELKYSIGGKNQQMDTTLLTTKIYEPVSQAKTFSDHISVYKHKWETRYTVKDVSEDEYNASPYKDITFNKVFPQKPTEELAISGKHYYEQTSCFKFNEKFMLISWWLECT